jgi:predicted CXXCH cytochrome family protein
LQTKTGLLKTLARSPESFIKEGGNAMKIAALILTGVIILMSCAASKVRKPEEMPKSAKVHDCDMCHLPHQGEMAGKILLNKPLQELCVSCHRDRVGRGEHKVGIRPLVTVKELPLDADGKITCITCHDPHDTRGFGMLLRAPRFSDFCIKCHKGNK